MNENYFFDGFDNKRYCLDISTTSIFEVDELMELLIKDENLNDLESSFDKNIIDEYKALLKEYKNNGFLREEVESENVNDIKHISSIALMMSTKCNLSCKYCFNDGGTKGENKYQFMTKEKIENAIDYIIDKSNNDIMCAFFGGEPLINWELIKYTVQYCKTYKKNWKYSITVNGTLLTKEIIQFFKENKFYVQVSYDGIMQDKLRTNNEGNGFRNLIRNNIKLLVKELPKNYISMRCILTHDTLPYIKDIIEESMELGIKILFGIVSLPNNHNLNLTNDDYDKYYDEIQRRYVDYWSNEEIEKSIELGPIGGTIKNLLLGRKKCFSCGLGKNIIAVGPDGEIYPCHRFIGITQYSIGNVNEGIDESKSSKYLNRSVDNREECSKCWARYLCGGGCAYVSIEKYGDESIPSNQNCILTKRELELGLKIYVELMKSSNESRLNDVIYYLNL